MSNSNTQWAKMQRMVQVEGQTDWLNVKRVGMIAHIEPGPNTHSLYHITY